MSKRQLPSGNKTYKKIERREVRGHPRRKGKMVKKNIKSLSILFFTLGGWGGGDGGHFALCGTCGTYKINFHSIFIIFLLKKFQNVSHIFLWPF